MIDRVYFSTACHAANNDMERWVGQIEAVSLFLNCKSIKCIYRYPGYCTCVSVLCQAVSSGGSALTNVLVSLSGANFRSNNFTDEQGALSYYRIVRLSVESRVVYNCIVLYTHRVYVCNQCRQCSLQLLAVISTGEIVCALCPCIGGQQFWPSIPILIRRLYELTK